MNERPMDPPVANCDLYFGVMAQGIKKADLEALSDAKLRDALLLCQNRRYSNAYYLGGYSIELALKACIADRMSHHTIPDKKFILAVHTHNLAELVGVAGLKLELRKKEDADPQFSAYWGVVAKWTPESRYESTDSMTCQLFLSGISHNVHGVLPWIKTFW